MNGWSDYKVVLSDLTAFDLIYLPLYFHIFRYFIRFSITDFSKISAQVVATLVNTTPIMPDITDLDTFADYLKDNMDSFSEEARLGFVEKLMPKDFPTALN